MFRNREDAGHQLAGKLADRAMTNPIVMGIPRGGVVTGAELARTLGADFDVVLTERLSAPGTPKVALGALTEDGFMYLDPDFCHAQCESDGHLAEERSRQLRNLARREQRIRQILPRSAVEDRTVIVTDDGVVSGSTMIAALQSLQPLKPRELLVAVPVISSERVSRIRECCDDLFALVVAPNSIDLRRCYEDLSAVTDKQVLSILGQFRPAAGRRNHTIRTTST